MNNLAELIRAAASDRPDAVFGTFEQNDALAHVVRRAEEVSALFGTAGVAKGDVVALIGTNCAGWLVTWMAAQLAGAQTALLNPSYPAELLGTMLDQIRPRLVVWIGREREHEVAPRSGHVDASKAWEGRFVILQAAEPGWARGGTGESAAPADIAAYIHTSGTTGTPKFCALSHEYFLRLGRFFADTLGMSRHDVVVNPLPLFHINPLGQTVVGALVARTSFLSTNRFSTTTFWAEVKQHGATILVLHGPPAGMLKARTTTEDAYGHQVRVGFFCDPAFLRQFQVPIGIGGYGSTEAGGYCHRQIFRPDDTTFPPEGPTHLSGQPRHDLDCSLSPEGEILVKGKAPHVLFSGYARNGTIDPSLDESGWFHTGDRGRFDEVGNLIFIERMSESIRVNAEYVPIDFIEERLRTITCLGEFALWRIDSPERGHQAVIYTTSRDVDAGKVLSVFNDLPRFMRPVRVFCIERIPRDAGVGKVQRRLLGSQPVLRTVDL